MKKMFTGLIMGLACWAIASASHAETKYALCVGINKYTLSGCNTLNGCVNDSAYFYTNLVERGGWQTSNMTKLNDSKATKANIRAAISNFSSKAKSGDIFVYQHSSHGDSGLLCTYNAEYKKSELAADLRNFESGVKVIIVVDACYSGSLFKDRAARKAYLESWDFAGEVSREMDAQQADAIARGVKGADKALTSSEIGWVTAASDSETSIDFGYYDTDLWLTDPQYEEGNVIAGTFLGSATWGWWKGTGDTSSVGDKDGYCDPLEFWKIGYDFCTNLDRFWGESDCSYHPQHTNDNVLKSVELGWAGDEEPGGVRFAPIPAQIATVGETLSYTLVATNTDGSTGAITYRVASASAPSTSYSLDGANFRFTPPADGTCSFSFLATNSTAKTFGKASMTVDASLAAPTGLANSGITATSFTANWGAVSGAGSYLLDVASSAFGAKAAAKADDALLSENFDAFSGTSADRSSNLDEYLTGTGWTGSKVFENAGSAKLGSGSYNGWIATPELDLSSGGTVSFLLTQYGTDANTVSVSILADGTETEIGSATPGSAETVEFAIPAASAATSVKIATSAKRAIIDDLVVAGGSAADVLAGQEVAGTSFTVDGLNTDTYYWRVRAVGNAKGPFSETMDVDLVADPSAPPSIRAIDDIEIEVGETATAQVKVSAPDEAPVTSLSITDGDPAATLEDGVFSFAPAAPGTYGFTITAVNANDSASVSFAVVATLADPETPEQPAVIGSDSFTAAWEPVPGAESYELLVIEGKGGTSGGGGSGAGSILTETFADATYSTSGSGYANQTISGGTLGTWTATQCRGDQGNPTVGGTGTLTSPEIAGGVSAVEFDYSWPFSETTSCDIDLYVGGNKVASANVTGGTAGTATYSFDAVSGATSVQFVNTHATAKKMRIRFDEIRITTAGAKSIAKAAGDVVFSNNVGNVTSYEVTGLQPLTEYTFAFRAIAGDEATEWSEPVGVKTADGPAPADWADIPAQSAAVGYPFSIDLSAYVSGVPTPTLSLASGTAELNGTVLSFTPAAVGDYAFTVTASNTSGDPADATFTVSAIEHQPTKYAVCVGINEYADISGLEGCVNDSIYMENNLVERGRWAAENVVRLNDAKATKAAIRKAIADVAAKAQAGDTFVYQHSSHGGQFNATDDDEDPLTGEEGKATFLCVYDEDYYDNTTAYNDYEIAADLAAFNAGVKVAVIVDACHSGGLFKSKEAARAAAAAFDLAGRVTAIMEADRAARKARGENVAKALSPAEIGWATAAEYYEYSYDGGFYHTDEWLTNNVYGDEYYNENTQEYNYPSSYKQGGVFLASATWNWWNGDADTDGDGSVDVLEFWQKGYDFCSVIGEFWYDDASYNYFPQSTNAAVLKSIELGYAGTPTLDAPVAAEAADVTASSFTASWSAVDGATGYHLQVATDPTFSTGASTDTLTAEDFAATTTTYTEFSGVAKDSGAVYAGKSAKNSAGAIQLNATTTTGAGIWTTASGGNVSRVAVVWNSGTTTSKPRSLLIYGSDSPLTSYDAVKAATSLGSIVYGSASSLDIEGAYAYVGILANGGALYLDSIGIDWGVPGSASSIVVDQNVGNVTNYQVTGLEPETDYWYRVQALGDPVDSDFSNVIALTTEGGTPAAPAWDAIPPQSVVAGQDLVLDLNPYVSGSPKPTITADAGTVEAGVLTVSFAEAGGYTVTVTADNSEGTKTATIAVTVTAAPVTVPVLTLSNASNTTFDAEWTECTDATSYQLQVATDDQFSTGSAAGKVTLFNNTATNPATVPEGWTYAVADTTSKYLKLLTDNSVVSATVSTKGFSSLTLTFKARSFGAVSDNSSDVLVEYTTDKGMTWNPLQTVTPASGSLVNQTVDAAACIGNAEVAFRWSAPNATASVGAGISTLVLSGEGTGGEGSIVLDTTTSGINYTVVGLTPETTYYARVRMAGGEWSAVEHITTTEVGGEPVEVDIAEVTIDSANHTLSFTVPEGAVVMTTTDLVNGPWVEYEGEWPIPMTDGAAFFRIGNPPAGN